MIKRLIATLLASCCIVHAGAPPLAKDNNEFAFSLYKQVQGEKNVLFSPYSIFSCLSMAYLGAKGATADEMKRTLEISQDADTLPQAYQQLNASLHTLSEDAVGDSLSIANALWTDLDTILLPEYTSQTESAFRATITNLDFSNADIATSIINNWISNKTHQKIPELLHAGDITADTRMVLTNAIYFKGSWQTPFRSDLTKEDLFWPSAEQSVKTPFMHMTASLSHFQNDLAQVLLLPFAHTPQQKRNFACLFFLPKNGVSLEEFLKDFDETDFRYYLSQLLSQRIMLSLPKFCTKLRLSLSSILPKMGMKLAFTDGADFSGIDGLQDLRISSVIHEALFDLDEKGVTAAAATATGMTSTSMPSEPPLVFNANRPFLYFLVDVDTQTILFMGVINNPTEMACH